MIAVCITTYNQEAFIAQAIESVLAQKCDEPIRIYIGDDASSDGTQAICERHAQQDKRIIYVRRENNTGLTNNTIDLYRRIIADDCEYIAMLDGDDYWTDSHKLQLQIDYLRCHSEVGYVHTNGRTMSGQKTWTFGQIRHSISFGWTIPYTVYFINERNGHICLRKQRFGEITYPYLSHGKPKTSCACTKSDAACGNG